MENACRWRDFDDRQHWSESRQCCKLGVLTPDAVLDNERFLYRLSPETLAQNQAAIARYRSRVSTTNAEPIYA